MLYENPFINSFYLAILFLLPPNIFISKYDIEYHHLIKLSLFPFFVSEDIQRICFVQILRCRKLLQGFYIQRTIKTTFNVQSKAINFHVNLNLPDFFCHLYVLMLVFPTHNTKIYILLGT